MPTKSIPLEAVKNIISGFPRRKLVHLPTPLQLLENLSAQLGINLWVKRDDMTGLAMGGNKGRKLEFVIADALTQGADCMVTWAGAQSNWCFQMTAASRRCGLKPILILFKRPGLPSGLMGNAFLDRIYDADIHLVDLGSRSMMDIESVRDLIDEIVERERKAGRKCYVAPIGASMTGGSMTRPLGAIGFLDAAVELLEQAEDRNLAPDAVVFATGSGSMQAGLIAGSKLLRPRMRTVGISVSDPREETTRVVETITQQTIKEMPENLRSSMKFGPDDIIVFDEYIGHGYGLLNQDSIAMLRTVAKEEGLILDPVYTGKAFLGMLDLVHQGYFRRGENVVFLHTGGLPALFAYQNEIMENLASVE